MNSVSVIGMGKVGSAVAYAISQIDGVERVILYNRTKERAIANAMDIQDAFPLKEIITGDRDDILRSDILVLCVGTNKYLSLKDRGFEYRESTIAVKDICKMVEGYGGLVINVTNPLERITDEIRTYLPKAMVIDTGTLIDAKRLIALTKEQDVKVIGRHDGEKKCFINGHRADPDTERYIENRAWEIVANKGYTNWAIAQVVKEMIERIVKERW